MSLQSRLKGAGLALGLLVTFSLPAVAQQQSATTQNEDSQQQTERIGKKRWHRGGHGMRGAMRMFRELDLSEAQKQQASAIVERYKESTRAQREEMRQLHQQKRQSATGAVDTQTQARAEALRTELRESHKRMRDELLTILTPDQRAKFEQLKEERKTRHEEWRKRRQGKTDNNIQ
ncbi:MAG TPA: Spy/CpxP family protein refolding chaperone [Pyrinomonadaceae bacterium]|jgi:Spy/CpxP family protein refolding chaperone